MGREGGEKGTSDKYKKTKEKEKGKGPEKIN